jgi:spoIIIJ-associated protein
MSDFSMESLLPVKEKPVRAKKKTSPRVEVELQKHVEAEKAVSAPVVEKVSEKEPSTPPTTTVEQTVQVVDVEPAPQQGEQPVEEVASPESLEVVKNELSQIVALMGYPSTVELEVEGLSVACVLRGDFEEELTGADGKVLDSIQYILRKIITRKVAEKLRISINVGEFREKRLENLKDKAIELAGQVKEDGKTQVLPALNPSERRAIHMILQEDKEIRSRSVGDGLFKKILIYKPGKNNRGGRKKTQGKGRPQKSSENSEPQSES